MISAFVFLSSLVSSQTGDIPLILSAPHGGSLEVPDCPKRLGTGVKQFVTVRDTHADEIAQGVADEISKLSGHRPYFVIAHFSRVFADANRPIEDGAESDAGRRVWNEYHDGLKAAIQDLAKHWSGGLLVDIHSQGRQKDVVFRGTRGKKSLKSAHEIDFLQDLVTKSSWTIDPPLGEDHEKSFDGGYIVATYGGKDYITSALQLEFGSTYRTPLATRKATCHALAEALLGAIKTYRQR